MAATPVSERYADQTIHLVTSTDDAVRVIRSLATDYTRIAMDTETVMEATVNPLTAKLRVISLAADHGPGTAVDCWVLDVRDMDLLTLGAEFTHAGTGKPFNRLTVYGWNAGFDDPVTTLNLTRHTTDSFSSLLFWEDLMLYEACLRLGAVGNSWYAGLADVAKAKLGVAMEGKGTVQLSYDATSDLTHDQVLYAGYDARVTLDLVDILVQQVADADLQDIVTIVTGSRPVWQGMRVHGVEFDVDDWRQFIEKSDAAAADALSRLAELTGGGQSTLFSANLAPNWNPGSDVDVKKILNTYDRDRVHTYTAGLPGSGGKGRDLGPADSVDRDQLSLIGGDIASLVALWRRESKIRTSFGDNIIKLVGPDGRMRPEFTQALIATGRASSRNPNLQAITPHAKSRMRPTFRLDDSGRKIPRVYIQGDYSQAELRGLAQLADEKVFKTAFEAGRDLHEATAESMFGLDMAALQQSNPKEYKKYRSMAKPLNFGIAYGMRAALLAQNLTVGGTPTTRSEADELLKQWHQAMTGAAAWLGERDQHVENLAANLPACDWEASWRLHLLWPMADQVYRNKTVRARLGHRPDELEIAAELVTTEKVSSELEERLGRAATAQEIADEVQQRTDAIVWARSYLGSVVLLADGTPFAFESRTIGGRRRLFQVPTASWIQSMALISASSRKPAAAAVRTAFEQQTGATLSEESGSSRVPLSRGRLAKVFEDKSLQLRFVSHVLQSMPQAADWLMSAALADCVKGLGNAYRNAPIQGSVADAVELCFSRLWPRLEREAPGAHVILSVHDSIVVECDLEQAPTVRAILAEEMYSGLAAYLPDVPVKVDLDIQASAAGDSLIEEGDIPHLLTAWQDHPDVTSVSDLLTRVHDTVPA